MEAQVAFTTLLRRLSERVCSRESLRWRSHLHCATRAPGLILLVILLTSNRRGEDSEMVLQRELDIARALRTLKQAKRGSNSMIGRIQDARPPVNCAGSFASGAPLDDCLRQQCQVGRQIRTVFKSTAHIWRPVPRFH